MALTPPEHRVVVLGASPKPDRYSNMALRQLSAGGYAVVPVHPRAQLIEGLPVTPRLAQVGAPVHTLTLYVGPQRLEPLIPDIVALAPGRVIMNPGTESPELAHELAQARVPVIYGCTLVMLSTGQF